MGLLDLLSPALTVGTNAAAAYQGAQVDERDKQRREQMQMLEFLRQKQIADSENSYRQAESRRADAQAKASALTPLRTVVGTDGRVSLVPLKYDETGSTPPKVQDTGIVANPPNQPHATAGLVNGTPTMFEPGAGGVSKPVTINGQPVAPIPRAPRGGTSDMDLVHAMTSVRAQLDEARRSYTAAQAQAKPLASVIDSSLTTPTGLTSAQASRGNLPALQQRIDSLRNVYSALASRQQREAGAVPVARPDGAATPTSTTAAPVVGGGRGGGAGVPVKPSAGNQKELDTAKQQLDIVLRSPSVSPEMKQQAKDAYVARLRALGAQGSVPPQ